MIPAEFKKILFVQKGIFIILAMLAFDYFWYCHTNRFVIETEQFKDESVLYAVYEGEITQEKLEQIENDYKNYEPDNSYFDVAYKSIIEDAERKLEKMEEPYLVYSRGWSSLIAELSPNYPLMIVSLIMSVLIFASDSGSKVRNLHNTSVNGRRRMTAARIVVYAAIELVFIAIQGIMEYIYAVSFIGARCPAAPLQSVLENCILNISIIEGYLIVLLLKFIGTLIGGLAVCLIASIIRNVYMSFVTGVLMFFEWYFLSALYELPYLIPEHLFVSNKYFCNGNLDNVIFISAIIITVILTAILLINNERSRRRII